MFIEFETLGEVKKVCLNLKVVESFYPSDNGTTTLVTRTNDYTVTNSYEEVVQIFNFSHAKV